MGIVVSWLAQCLYPEDQVIWQAARAGDAYTMRSALARLTPQTRRYIEWQEPYSGRTAMAAAAAMGHRECARLLLQAGADANVKDYKGNTPLHLACKHGKPAVAQLLLEMPRVIPFATNLCMKTPLDVARHRFTKEDEAPMAYQECIELLEKKFCLYSGWLYEKTDNVLSYVSGLSSLNSWTRRFCIVLERGTPEILELALFNMRPTSGKRPVCPSTVVLYHVAAGMAPAEDTKWFNRKEHTFILQGAVKDTKAHCEVPIVMQPLEFAAVDDDGYSAWKSFFEYHQQQLVMLRPSDHQTMPRRAQPSALRPQPQPYPAASATNRSQPVDEDEDLRRAIILSLQTAPLGAASTANPPTAAVSAPDWEEDSEMYPPSPSKPGMNGNSTTDRVSATSEAGSPVAAARSPLVVNFAQAPSYSSIGECVICFDGPQAAVCVPCGHNAVCMACAEEILETTCECPVCRQPIRELIKLYRV